MGLYSNYITESTLPINEATKEIKKDKYGWILGNIKGKSIHASGNISKEDISDVIKFFKKDAKIINDNFDTILEAIAISVNDYAKDCYSKEIQTNPKYVKYKELCEKFLDKEYCKSNIKFEGGRQDDDGEYSLFFSSKITDWDGHVITLESLNVDVINNTILKIHPYDIIIDG